MITFFLMNLAVGLSAYLLVYRLFCFTDLIDSLLAFFLLYFSQIILSEITLGIFGALTLTNVVLLNLIILSIVFYFSRDKRSCFKFSGIKEGFSKVLSNKTVLF
ncbi:MAG: hypothetical protein KJ926_03085, partial [Candidatus Omnitrophica bacterium]|nr:hypothetical protein [Candidatus Omnitrophota bacterium]